jgi:methionyl-tRNA formyltransferase
VFFGTPTWAVPSLDELIASSIAVDAVVTNPDRPAGRGMKMSMPPVKRRALDAGIEVLQPERARNPELQERIKALGVDLCVVVAYGKILPGRLLELPRLGFVNVHFSILPSYRGAAPVQWAIINGDGHSGVSIIVLTEGMDEGPVLATREEPIGPDDTGGDLGDRLAGLGAGLLVETLHGYAGGSLKPREQDHEQATYAHKLSPDDARVDWSRPAARVRDLVRGLNPVPGAWTTLESRRLKVWMGEAIDRRDLSPGEMEATSELVVGTGDGALILTDVQLEGKSRMQGSELARGLRTAPGARVE